MKKIFGWLFLLILTSTISFWAFWGIIESFYEGWYFPSFVDNLWLTVSRYLLPIWVLLIPGVIAVYFRRTGAILYISLGVFISYFFSQWIFFVPLFVIALLRYTSQLPTKKVSLVFVLGIPMATLFVSGIQPASRIWNRSESDIGIPFTAKVDDEKIIWAPPGPGWPRNGVDWFEASNICLYLSQDGIQISDTIVGLWRLPKAEEIVASTYFRGRPMVGTWSVKQRKAEFKNVPDKEPPLWDPYSPIIYWWTSDEVSMDSALMYSYNAVVFVRSKYHKAGYYGFRAIRLQ